MQANITRVVAMLGMAIACHAAVHAEDFEGCVPATEGVAISLAASSADKPIKAVVMGRGERGVVFSNTAYDAPCAWLPLARELVAKGYRVALWRYGGPAPKQLIADLGSVVAELRRRGATKVALVGGSRGGCLSMMTAAEVQPPVAGVVMLSCAAVFNRRDPTPTAPWAAKLQVPVLHLTGERDGTPTLAEARREFDAFASPDKQLVVVPTGGHGDQLLNDPQDGAVVKPQVIAFLDRVTR
jgi:pimeloyl-ACP methyl ester carboxylesterase